MSKYKITNSYTGAVNYATEEEYNSLNLEFAGYLHIEKVD